MGGPLHLRQLRRSRHRLVVQMLGFIELTPAGGYVAGVERIEQDSIRPIRRVESLSFSVESFGLIPVAQRDVRGREIAGPQRGILDVAGLACDVEALLEVRNRTIEVFAQEIRP